MATGTKTSRSNYQQVVQHLKCPVHLGKLREPRRLPCEHTLCTDCLRGVIKRAMRREDRPGVFECPVCRAGHQLPSTEMEDWAHWFPVDTVTAIQLKTLARFQDSPVCEVHIDKLKEYYCFHHRDVFCPQCVITRHTEEPCYTRNCRDAVHDVRRHISDLVAGLRLQEARAQRLAGSAGPAAHTDGMLQTVWETENALKRFHKRMQSKFEEARHRIENATKSSQADKDQLKTVQGLITQTKIHVEELLETTNTKTIEGQSEILRLWKPLDDEMQSLAKVLDVVEKRPFCVSLKVDDAFMDFISQGQDRLVVVNGSDDTTPLASKRSHSVGTAKSSRRHKQKTTYLTTSEYQTQSQSKVIKENPTSPQMNVETISNYRKLPSLRHNRKSTASTTRDQADTGNLSQRSSDKHRNLLPRLAAGNLTTGGTSMVFNVKHLKLRAINLQSTFEFPCEDILVLTSHIVTTTERAVQRFTLRYQFLESLPVRAPLKLCAMRDDSDNIMVLDNNGGISLVSTQGRLKLLHKVDTGRLYTGLCHVRTTTTEDAYGRCQCHLHLALTHLADGDDCIDVIVVTYEKHDVGSGGIRLGQENILTPVKVKTICGSYEDPVLKNILCICTAPESRKLLVGTENGLVCLGRGGDIIWVIPTDKYVSSIECRKGHIFVAIEMARIIVVLDPRGNPLLGNMIPPGSTIGRPARISLGKTAMVIKEYNTRESSTHDQKSIVHVLNLSWM